MGCVSHPPSDIRQAENRLALCPAVNDFHVDDLFPPISLDLCRGLPAFRSPRRYERIFAFDLGVKKGCMLARK